MIKIAPSILSADFADLKNEIIKLDEAKADMIHLDVMDGNFVPNLTFGPCVIKSIRPYTKLMFDAHLMVDNPDKMLEWFALAGADIITVHAEVCPHLDKTLDAIHKLGVKAGVALNPSTSESVLEYVLDKLDLILVMTVNPGFGGQQFMDNQLEKIAKVKKMIGSRNIILSVDGGINPMTASEAISAGADMLVAGSAVFSGNDYAKNISALR
ncbi:MAG: ribulose-phosphate 3-epimerase [Alphaproteobacteria bacterium]|nr:ribulose-phosphate 3-epimerase [Alphaproteobacteria bacterium]